MKLSLLASEPHDCSSVSWSSLKQPQQQKNMVRSWRVGYSTTWTCHSENVCVNATILRYVFVRLLVLIKFFFHLILMWIFFCYNKVGFHKWVQLCTAWNLFQKQHIIRHLISVNNNIHDCQKGFCPGHSVETIGLFYNFNIVTLITKSLRVCYREENLSD